MENNPRGAVRSAPISPSSQPSTSCKARRTTRNGRRTCMVTGTIRAPVPSILTTRRAGETSAIQAFETHQVPAFMEISFRIADSAKSVLGSTEGPKAAWGSLREMRRCEVARAAICPHDGASDYQVGWQWYYPHSLRLYGQPPCRDNRCWHDSQ